MPAFSLRSHSPDGAATDCGDNSCSLLLIYRPRKDKAESAWLADLQRTVYPHKWSPISCRSNAGQRKLAGQRPTFYRCATEPLYTGLKLLFETHNNIILNSTIYRYVCLITGVWQAGCRFRCIPVSDCRMYLHSWNQSAGETYTKSYSTR